MSFNKIIFAILFITLSLGAFSAFAMEKDQAEAFQVYEEMLSMDLPRDQWKEISERVKALDTIDIDKRNSLFDKISDKMVQAFMKEVESKKGETSKKPSKAREESGPRGYGEERYSGPGERLEGPSPERKSSLGRNQSSVKRSVSKEQQKFPAKRSVSKEQSKFSAPVSQYPERKSSLSQSPERTGKKLCIIGYDKDDLNAKGFFNNVLKKRSSLTEKFNLVEESKVAEGTKADLLIYLYVGGESRVFIEKPDNFKKLQAIADKTLIISVRMGMRINETIQDGFGVKESMFKEGINFSGPIFHLAFDTDKKDIYKSDYDETAGKKNEGVLKKLDQYIGNLKFSSDIKKKKPIEPSVKKVFVAYDSPDSQLRDAQKDLFKKMLILEQFAILDEDEGKTEGYGDEVVDKKTLLLYFHISGTRRLYFNNVDRFEELKEKAGNVVIVVVQSEKEIGDNWVPKERADYGVPMANFAFDEKNGMIYNRAAYNLSSKEKIDNEISFEELGKYINKNYFGGKFR